MNAEVGSARQVVYFPLPLDGGRGGGIPGSNETVSIRSPLSVWRCRPSVQTEGEDISRIFWKFIAF